MTQPDSEKPRSCTSAALIETDQPSLARLGDSDPASHCDAFVIVVESPTGRHRRRVYLSLHSAGKALKRAQLDGGIADMVLCHLVPVGVADQAVL